jgi:hypothetical protein
MENPGMAEEEWMRRLSCVFTLSAGGLSRKVAVPCESIGEHRWKWYDQYAKAGIIKPLLSF